MDAVDRPVSYFALYFHDIYDHFTTVTIINDALMISESVFISCCCR